MKLDHPPGATPLDPDEAAGLLPSSITTQSELNAFEQANILDAQRWAFKRPRKTDVLADGFVLELHRRMFNQVWSWAGRYRASDKNIGVPWHQVPMKVRELCEDARYWIDHASYAWDELGVRFHHRLVAIHPFANGNGRHARLMTDVLLTRNQQTPFTWGAGGDLVAANDTRARYLHALRAGDARDYRPLLAFVRS